MKRLFGAALLAVLAWGCGGSGKPRLVLLISVDQLRADYLTRFADLYEGGFQTLLDQGAVFENAAYRHGVTVTAAGHASISTGMHPSHHGMVGNSWWDYAKNADNNCIADDDYPPVGGPGRAASPIPLFAETFGDMLKEAHEGSKVVSVSFKDRAAILMGGRRADLAMWFSAECGCFVSSTYYGPDLPQWAKAFNDAKPADRYVGASWTPLLDDPALYSERARADAFETEERGLDGVFPHRMPDEASRRFYSGLNPTPFPDELVLDLALAALEGEDLGGDGEPDVLAVGFSATDYTGHDYGPFSQEAMDVHLRLDRLLGRLLGAIDEKVGLDNVVVALSADHGVLPLPEDPRAANGKRISKNDLVALADRAAQEQFPQLERAVVAVNSGNLFLDLPGFEAAGVERADVEDAIAGAFAASDDVVRVFTHRDLIDDADQDPLTVLHRNSFFERRSPQLMIAWKEGVYPGAGRTGTSHGSPWLYDRAVPVILMGRGVRGGRYAGESGPEDVAPTIETLLGLEPKTETDTRVLREALQ